LQRYFEKQEKLTKFMNEQKLKQMYEKEEAKEKKIQKRMQLKH